MLFKFCQFFITKFFLKNYFFFIKILFAAFNVLFVGYFLGKNNLNNTYQCNMILKKKSKKMNYLIIFRKNFDFTIYNFSNRNSTPISF
jgi:hypothetical protein